MKENTKLYKRVVPFLVAGGIAFGTGTFLGYTPFYSDKDVVKQDYMKEIFPDNQEKITYIDDSYNTDDFIKRYSKWEEQDDGSYKRDVNYYFFTSYEKDTLQEIAKNSGDLEPSLTSVEVRPSLTNEELDNNEEFSTVIMFDETEKVVKESKLINTLSTSAEIAAFLLLVLGIRELEGKKVRKK